VKLHAADRLVINGNFRVVPAYETLPTCKEVRRGTVAISSVTVDCNVGGTCQRDAVVICLKQQDYKWVKLSEL
jgi:hypothetical protein